MSVRDTVGHTVLATADSEMFTSLRRRPTSRPERYAMGRALRRQVPRKSLGAWTPPAGRPDPDPVDHGIPRGPAGLADPGPRRPDGHLAVRVPARHRDRDGRRRLRAAGDRHPAGDLRRRAPGQLRFLRLAGGRAGDRPERLRRGPSRKLGVGSAPAGRQHLGGRPGERVDRGAVSRLGAGLRRRVPQRGAFPGRTAAADAQLQPTRRRPVARDGDGEVAAGGDRAVGQAGPDPDQRSRAATVHRRARGPPAHRRGAAADHPAGPGASTRRSARRWTSTWPPWPRTGDG